MRIWLPEVHELFGDRLHYYLLTVRPFDERFRANMEAFKNDQHIGGFCFYEVFGSFDVILRVWIPANGVEDKFIDNLRKVVPQIERAIPFRVTDIPKYWLRD